MCLFLTGLEVLLLNSNSIRKQWMKSHFVEMPLQIPLLLLLLLLLLSLLLLYYYSIIFSQTTKILIKTERIDSHTKFSDLIM